MKNNNMSLVKRHIKAAEVIQDAKEKIKKIRIMESELLKQYGFSDIMDFYTQGRRLEEKRKMWQNITRKNPEYVIAKMLENL